MILSGMLRQYEGQIQNIQLRQRRAKVAIPILGKTYSVTLPVIGI